MKNPFGLISLVVLLVLCFLYTDISVFGVGLPVVLMLYLIVSGLLIANYSGRAIGSIGLRKVIFPVTLWYLLFSMCFVLALFLSGSLSSDIRYATSLTLQFLWFPALYLAYRYRPKAFSVALRVGVAFSGLILIVSLLLGIVSSGDILTLRNASSFVTHGDGFFLIPDVLDNPNRAARSALLLLFIGLVHQLTMRSRRKRYWRLFNVAMSLFIVLSFSRACIVGLLVLWLVYMFFLRNRGWKGRTTNLAIGSVVMLCMFFTAALVLPGIGDRFEKGMVSLVEARDSYRNEQVLAREMTIRARTWAASMLIIRDNPVSGVGVGNALVEMGNYGAVASKGGVEQPVWVHGGFLKVALYGGMLSIIPMVFFLIRLGFKYLNTATIVGRKLPSTKELSWLSVGLLVATVPVNVGADSFGYSMTWFVFALPVCVLATRNVETI